MKKRSNLKKYFENVFDLKLFLGGQSLHLPPTQLADVVATCCCDVVARQARLVWRQDPGKNRLGRFILILRTERTYLIED